MREHRIRGVQNAGDAGDRRQDGTRTWRKRGDGVRTERSSHFTS